MHKICDICKSIIYFLAAVVLAGLTAANLVWTIYVSYNHEEEVTFTISFWYLIPLALIVVLLFLFVKNVDKINIKWLFILGSIIYLVFGLYILLNTEDFIRNDAGSLWNAAGQILSGDYSSLEQDGYIGYFPYQLGFTTYDMAIRFFGGGEKTLYFLNLLEVLVINYFGYKISDKLFSDDRVNKLVVLIEFLFLPQFFFFMFGYGIVPGFCAFIIAVYFFICICKGDSQLKNIILMIVFATLANLLKSNYGIGAIALGMALFIQLFDKKEKKDKKKIIVGLVSAVLVIIIPLSSDGCLKAIYQIATGVEIGEGAPVIANFAMGMDIDNNTWGPSGPGWYDGSNAKDYENHDLDSQATSEYEIAKIKNSLQQCLQEPKKAALFYVRKVVSMWCEPLFQSIWSGPKENTDRSMVVSQPLLVSMYTGGTAAKAFGLFAKPILILILAAALGFLLLHRKEYSLPIVFYLYILGGFTFHLFSEAKAQYSYMYVFALIPLAAYMICGVGKRIDSKKEK